MADTRITRKPVAVNVDPDHGVGSGRQISHVVRIAGVEIPTWKRWNKVEHAYSANSSLTLTMRLEESVDLFAISQELSKKSSPMTVEVYTTIVIDGKTVFNNVLEFAGIVDTVEADYDNNEYVVQGKSYATILLNEKVNEAISSTAFQALSTSQAVEQLVAKFGGGLKCVVKNHLGVYHFTTPVGKIYKDRRVKVATNISVWDLLMGFAREDNADIYVRGDTLYYVPKPTDTSVDVTELKGVSPDYTYTYPENVLMLRVAHSPLQSHDVTVIVTSYQPRTGQTYVATKSMSDEKINALAKALELNPTNVAAMYEQSIERVGKDRKPRQPKVTEQRNSATVREAPVRRKERYSFQVSNASQEDCDRIASRIMRDIASKEFVVNLSVLGQPDFTPRQYIRLKGTKSRVTDQVYAIKQLETVSELSDSGGEVSGYVSSFTLVNHAVQTVGTVLGE